MHLKLDSDPITSGMLGFGLPTNYVKVWAHGFAQQEGRERIPGVLVVLVAGQGGEWRSRTAATVAGTPGLQRADAAPELVATREDAGAQVVLDCVAARRPDGGDWPRARRVLEAGYTKASFSSKNFCKQVL